MTMSTRETIARVIFRFHFWGYFWEGGRVPVCVCGSCAFFNFIAQPAQCTDAIKILSYQRV